MSSFFFFFSLRLQLAPLPTGSPLCPAKCTHSPRDRRCTLPAQVLTHVYQHMFTNMSTGHRRCVFCLGNSGLTHLQVKHSLAGENMERCWTTVLISFFWQVFCSAKGTPSVPGLFLCLFLSSFCIPFSAL